MMQNTIYQENFLEEYRNRKEAWKAGIIDKRIGRVMYIIKDPKKTIKRHHNQIRKRYSEVINNRKEEPMMVHCDFFDAPMFLEAHEENW